MWPPRSSAAMTTVATAPRNSDASVEDAQNATLAEAEREKLKAWRRSRISQIASSRRAVQILQGDILRSSEKMRVATRGSPTARVAVALAMARSAVFQASSAAMRASRAVKKCSRLRALSSVREAAYDLSPHPLGPISCGAARLYEHFLIIGLPSKVVRHPSVKVPARYSPRVLHHRSSRGEVLEAEAIADFCLPAGAGVRRHETTEQRRIVEAIFVLSGGGEDGTRVQYGFCVHTIRAHDHLEADCCYCLITQLPFALMHFSALRAAVEADAAWRGVVHQDHQRSGQRRHKRRHKKGADETMRRYALVAVPRPGDLARLPLVDGTHVEWRRPSCNELLLESGLTSGPDGTPRYESTALIREWALPKMFRTLALENVLLVLGCALVELQIVFVSQHLRTLSACTLGLVSMLRPLRWVGPLVSALPAKMYEYLDSPVPLVIGVLSLPLDFYQGADMVLVFADEDRVRLPPKLLARPGAHLSIQLPQLSQLAHDMTNNYRAFRNACVDDDRQLQHPVTRVLTAVHQTPAAVNNPSDDTGSVFGSSSHSDDDDNGSGDDVLHHAGTATLARASNQAQQFMAQPEAVAAMATIAGRIHRHLLALLSTAAELRAERDMLSGTHLATHKHGRTGSEEDDESSARGSSTSSSMLFRDEQHAERRSLNQGNNFDRPSAVIVRRSLSLCDFVEAGCLSPSATARNEWWYHHLGDSGLSFIARFVETQMFTNYYYGSRNQDEHDADKEAACSIFSLMLLGGTARPFAHHQQLEEEDLGTPAVFHDDDDDEDDCRNEATQLMCNGQCNGRMDTAQCTLLCARLWEERQREEWRRRQVEKASREAAHHRSRLLRVEDGCCRFDPRRFESTRHPNETPGQFAKRQAMLHARSRPISAPGLTGTRTTTPPPLTMHNARGYPRTPHNRAHTKLQPRVDRRPAAPARSSRPRPTEIAVQYMRRVGRRARARRELRAKAADAIARWWRRVCHERPSLHRAATAIQACGRRYLARHRFGKSFVAPVNDQLRVTLRLALETELMNGEDKAGLRLKRRLSTKDERQRFMESHLRQSLDTCLEEDDDGRSGTNEGPPLAAVESSVTRVRVGDAHKIQATKVDMPLIKGCTTLTALYDFSFSSPHPLEQQQALGYADLEFRTALRAGVVCTKHSRFGKPHKRLLQCNQDFTELKWSVQQTSAPTTSFRRRVLASICRVLRIHKRRSIRLDQVVRVCGQASTLNAKRATNKGSLTSPHAKLVSLVRTSRSLLFPSPNQPRRYCATIAASTSSLAHSNSTTPFSTALKALSAQSLFDPLPRASNNADSFQAPYAVPR